MLGTAELHNLKQIYNRRGIVPKERIGKKKKKKIASQNIKILSARSTRHATRFVILIIYMPATH